MSAFEFFFTFYSLILGLGIAELLSGFARAWRVHKLGRHAIAALLLGILIAWEIMFVWMAGWHQFKDIAVELRNLALPLVIGGTYYVAAHMTFPERPEEWETLDAYYDTVKARVASAALVANLMIILLVDYSSIAAMIAHAQWQRLFLFYLPFNLCVLGAWLTLVLAKRRRWDYAAMGLLFLWYGWIMARGY